MQSIVLNPFAFDLKPDDQRTSAKPLRVEPSAACDLLCPTRGLSAYPYKHGSLVYNSAEAKLIPQLHWSQAQRRLYFDPENDRGDPEFASGQSQRVQLFPTGARRLPDLIQGQVHPEAALSAHHQPFSIEEIGYDPPLHRHGRR